MMISKEIYKLDYLIHIARSKSKEIVPYDKIEEIRYFWVYHDIDTRWYIIDYKQDLYKMSDKELNDAGINGRFCHHRFMNIINDYDITCYAKGDGLCFVDMRSTVY